MDELIEYHVFYKKGEDFDDWSYFGVWPAADMRAAIKTSNVGGQNPARVMVLDGRQKVVFERSGWRPTDG